MVDIGILTETDSKKNFNKEDFLEGKIIKILNTGDIMIEFKENDGEVYSLILPYDIVGFECNPKEGDRVYLKYIGNYRYLEEKFENAYDKGHSV